MDTLTRLDRCDAACSGAAVAVVDWEWGGRLMFCGHHTTKYKEALAAQGGTVLVLNMEETDTRTPATMGT